jgi:site-specific recombinase XerD
MADLRAFLRWSRKTRGAAASSLDCEAADIQEYCTYLQDSQEHAPATVNRRLQALRKFYSHAQDQGWTGRNPAAEVSLLGETVSTRSRFLTTADVSRLLAAVRQGRPRFAARDWGLFQVFLGAGLKLSELIMLQVDDVHVDRTEPTLQVRSASSEPERIVPLDSEVAVALRSYLAVRAAAPGVTHLFVNRDGNPLSARSVQRLLHHYAQEAGLQGLTSQALRYRYARKVYEKSGDLEAVARLLGHRHLATTIRYLRPSSPAAAPSQGQSPQAEPKDGGSPVAGTAGNTAGYSPRES